MKRGASLGLAIVVAVVGLRRVDAAVDPRLRRFFGAKTVSLVSSATRVEAFGIVSSVRSRRGGSHDSRPPAQPELGEVRGRGLFAKNPNLPEAFARRLSAIILDTATYSPRSPPLSREVIKGCAFDPIVIFRAWKGPRYVDVLLCFACDDLMVAVDKQRESDLEWVDFSEARAALLSLAKEALPHPFIQAIPTSSAH